MVPDCISSGTGTRYESSLGLSLSDFDVVFTYVPLVISRKLNPCINPLYTRLGLVHGPLLDVGPYMDLYRLEPL